MVTTDAVVRVVLASARRLPHFAPFLAVPINVLPTVVQMCVETTVVEARAECAHPQSPSAPMVSVLQNVRPIVREKNVDQMVAEQHVERVSRD